MKITLYLCENVFDAVKAMVKQLYDKNLRMIIIVPDQQQQNEYSQKFWNDRKFLPHGKSIDNWSLDNPILILTHEQITTAQLKNIDNKNNNNSQNNPNQADVCIIVDHIIDKTGRDENALHKTGIGKTELQMLNINRTLYMISAYNKDMHQDLHESNDYQIEDIYQNTQGKWHAVK